MRTSSLAPWLLTAIAAALATIPSVQAAPATMLTAANTTKPGCPRHCGNLTVPYPFGVGLYAGCSLAGPTYDIFCDTSHRPPKPFLFSNNQLIEVVDISETHIRIRTAVASKCFNSSGQQTSGFLDDVILMEVDDDSPFAFSSSSNKLIVVGCADEASVSTGPFLADDSASCNTKCSSKDDVVSGSCDAKKGCCQASTPKRIREFSVIVGSGSNNSEIASFNPCGYAFLGEPDKFVFNGASDLDDPSFTNRTMATVPVVLDWVIGNQTCAEAKKNVTGYVCRQNTTCSDVVENDIGGYQCRCLPGYQGNPYLLGCTDIDECEDSTLNQCSNICRNTEGSYVCTCPRGYSGDAKKDGTGCKKESSQILYLRLSLGLSFGFLFIVVGVGWVYMIQRKRRLIELKEKYFKQNGGLLMKELLSASNLTGVEGSKIFTTEDLKLATNNFSEDRLLGKGGYGTVYKGVLPNNQVVAIKKSKVVDQTQIEQFINEMVILTQINHRNVVKLLGCCLESEVPLLVYEYVANGTLFDQIHSSRNNGGKSWLTWNNCLKIAIEAADALAYLHSAALPPIIHRDVKSTNILLDDTYTAKISDFGASRLIPLDQSQLSTLVQGTLGYLDPEYFFSSLLTEKSDVYSFGVVLAELLTRKKPLDHERPLEQRSLTTYFVSAIEEERLFEIIDPQLVCGASREQVVAIAMLVGRCFSLKGVERPTMREVAMELEGIRKKKWHPWEEQGYQETEGDDSGEEECDLYPIQLMASFQR